MEILRSQGQELPPPPQKKRKDKHSPHPKTEDLVNELGVLAQRNESRLAITTILKYRKLKCKLKITGN